MTMNFTESQRLIAELTKITVHPELHNQVVWTQADKNPNEQPPGTACGTVGCLAGNAVITARFPLIWGESEIWNDETDRYELKWRASECKVEGQIRAIETAARDLFGLTQNEARDLFDQDNSLTDLWAKAIEYSNNWIGVEHVIEAFQEREAHLKSETRKAVLAAVAAV